MAAKPADFQERLLLVSILFSVTVNPRPRPRSAKR